MSGLHAWLFRIANEATSREQKRAERLRAEIFEAEKRKAKAQAELEIAQSASGRLDAFAPVLGGYEQCPLCWIERGIQSNLKPIDSETSVDWFRCETCHREMSKE